MNKKLHISQLCQEQALIKFTQKGKAPTAFPDQTEKIFQSPNKTNSHIRGYFLEMFTKV